MFVRPKLCSIENQTECVHPPVYLLDFFLQVDGKVHTGQGLSKPLAKQNAAENALKALLLEKMAQATIKVDSPEGSEPVQEEMNTDGASTPMVEGSDEMSDSGKPDTPEDDVPWGSLASFALYKLFTEWQNQGTHVPIPKQATVSPSKQVINNVASVDLCMDGGL